MLQKVISRKGYSGVEDRITRWVFLNLFLHEVGGGGDDSTDGILGLLDFRVDFAPEEVGGFGRRKPPCHSK